MRHWLAGLIFCIGVVVFTGCEAEPTPTLDFNAGWRFMQAMPCDQLIRYAEAAIAKAEDEGGWTYSDDGMTDLALLILRAEGIDSNTMITRYDVSDRLEECENG